MFLGFLLGADSRRMTAGRGGGIWGCRILLMVSGDSSRMMLVEIRRRSIDVTRMESEIVYQTKIRHKKAREMENINSVHTVPSSMSLFATIRNPPPPSISLMSSSGCRFTPFSSSHIEKRSRDGGGPSASGLKQVVRELEAM